jgi:hypothetical protein
MKPKGARVLTRNKGAGGAAEEQWRRGDDPTWMLVICARPMVMAPQSNAPSMGGPCVSALTCDASPVLRREEKKNTH